MGLWGRDELIAKLLAVRGRAEEPEPAAAQAQVGPPADEPIGAEIAGPGAATTDPSPAPANGQEERPLCVTCAVAVSDKVRDYCLTHASRFGGRIYCFKHQRGVQAAPVQSD